MSSRSCSQCGSNGHNSRTCGDSAGAAASGEKGGFMLFGVKVLTEEASASFRKSASMNNLSQYDQSQDPSSDVAAAGYESDDVLHASGRSRERKRGVPWTEEEHRLFLLGLQKVGKGDWRGISRNFVKSRTPTQVASHAQKYFLRRNNLNRRRRRSSLFDITTDTFMGSSMEEHPQAHQETVTLPLPQPQLGSSNPGGFAPSTFPVTFNPVVAGENSMEKLSLGSPRTGSIQSKTLPPKLIRPIPIPPSTKLANLNLDPKSPKDPLPLSLKLSTPSSDEESPAHSSAFQAMNGGDSIISVA